LFIIACSNKDITFYYSKIIEIVNLVGVALVGARNQLKQADANENRINYIDTKFSFLIFTKIAQWLTVSLKQC
jgi:hypothetical protein